MTGLIGCLWSSGFGVRPVALAGGAGGLGGALEARFRVGLPASVSVRLVEEEPVEVAARMALAAAVEAEPGG